MMGLHVFTFYTKCPRGPYISTVAILVFVGFVISSAISKPIQSLTSTMAELASGMLEVDIPNTHRQDEVGNMAKAVLVFKEGLIQSKELEEQQKEQQKADSARAQKLSDIVKNFDPFFGVGE